MPNCVCLQKATQESKRLYDFVVVTSQPLRMGLTFSALQASQPSSYGPEETREPPSDDHVLLKLLGYSEAEPLQEGVASKMNESVASPKESRVTHPTWKVGITEEALALEGQAPPLAMEKTRYSPRNGSPPLCQPSHRCTFIDEIDGGLVSNPPTMGNSLRSLHLLEVLVVLPTDVSHLLLEGVELVL